MPRATCLAAAVLATAADAQFSEFAAAPDKYTLPAGHVATSSRLAAGHFDHDLVLDAFYVSGASLVIVYGPAVYPYAAKVAENVGDFVVLPPSFHGAVSCSDVLVAGGSGLRRVAWDPEPAPVGGPAPATVSADVDWSSVHGLRAAPDPSGECEAIVLGISSDGEELLVGELNGLSLVTKILPIGSAVAQAVLLDFDPEREGLEIAVTTSAGLTIRDYEGVAIAPVVSPLSGVVGLSVNRGGGTASDTLLYSVAYPGAEHLLFEVGWNGSGTTLSNPLWSAASLLADTSTARISAAGPPDLVASFSNSAELVVLRQLPPPSPPVSNVDSFALPATPDFWRVDLARPEYGWPVIDPGMVCGDFDNDSIDDILLLDLGQVGNHPPRLLLHSGANLNQGANAPRIPGEAAALPPVFPSFLQDVLMINVSVQLALPSNWSPSSPPTHLDWEVWSRDGTTALIPRPSIASGQHSVLGLPIPSTFTFSEMVTVPTPPDTTPLYLRLSWVRLDATGTLLQRSATSSWLGANCEGWWQVGCIQCLEPDAYSPTCDPMTACNQEVCASSLVDGPPLIQGFNRRSRIGPFQN